MKNSLRQGIKIALLLCATSHMAFAQVGMQNIQVGSLPVTMIYPTDVASTSTAFGAFQLDVAVNAKPKHGIQRLIVMSHGTGGSSNADHQLAASLAKAGYIVAQPLHAGDNYKDTSKAGPESWKTRPIEVISTIDALAKDALWSPLFDASKVGVHGMSAGGHTAIALAGGQWNMLTMIQHCGKNADADAGFCFNGMAGDTAAQTKRRAQFKSGASAPEVYLPAELKTLFGGAQAGKPMDARIKAISLSVPLAAPFTASSLAAIQIPVGVVSADSDELLAPAFHSTRLLENCKTCTPLVDLKNAGHFDLLAPWPDSVAKETATKQVRGGMPNSKFNPQDRTQAFETIVQFFDQHLK